MPKLNINSSDVNQMDKKIAVVTLYTNNISELAELTNVSKRNYCKKWGYDYICETQTLDADRPPAWSKILLLKNNLDEYDWLYWIDADAIIMNLEVSLESIIDENYSMIVAKLESEDLFGNLHLNTGSFFIKSDAKGKKLLDDIYQQGQFTNHLCWEQKAFIDLYLKNKWVRDVVKVEHNSKRFNSSANVYDKGDFVFHAVGPIRTQQGKMDLINRIIREDRVIDYCSPPRFCAALAYTPELETTVFELTAASMMKQQEYSISDEIHFIKLQSPYSQDEQLQINRHIITTIKALLEQTNAEILIFSQPGVQFFHRWERHLLVTMGSHDIATSTDPETGAVRDDILIIKRNKYTISFLNKLVRIFEILNKEKQSEAHLLSKLLQQELITSKTKNSRPSCVLLPAKVIHLGNPLDSSKGLYISKLVAHSTHRLDLDESKHLLKKVRNKWEKENDNIRNTVISE